MEIRLYHTLPEEARQIREKVFVQEQHFQEEFDGTDRRAVHLVLYQGGSPAATCRYFQGVSPKEYLVGRMAVLKPFRGKIAEPAFWRGPRRRSGKREARLYVSMRSRGLRLFMRSKAIVPTVRWSTRNSALMFGAENPFLGWRVRNVPGTEGAQYHLK